MQWLRCKFARVLLLQLLLSVARVSTSPEPRSYRFSAGRRSALSYTQRDMAQFPVRLDAHARLERNNAIEQSIVRVLHRCVRACVRHASGVRLALRTSTVEYLTRDCSIR